MASSTDFKLLFEKYQEDGIKQGILIVKYCQMNGVVYSHFERWYKKCRADVVPPVEIVDAGGLIDKSEIISPSIFSKILTVRYSQTATWFINIWLVLIRKMFTFCVGRMSTADEIKLRRSRSDYRMDGHSRKDAWT